MSTSEVARDFDAISSAYDSTRDPLDAATIDGLADRLRSLSVHRLLEVGVGTGRVAVPLRAKGFEITGVDASLGMLSRARGKGLERLVRGNAYRLPFGDAAFDATLFVHVLHVLEEPERALAEAARVGHRGPFAVVHPADGGPRQTPTADSARRMLFEELRREGLTVPDRGSPMRRERELLARHPPQELTVLSERDVTESLSRRLDVLATRAHRWSLRIPPSALERALAAVRQRVGTAQVTYHRTEALAIWSQRSGPS